MNRTLAFFASACPFFLFAQNQPPKIDNVQTSVNGNELIIGYDVFDEEGDEVEITFRAGKFQSPVFDFETGNAIGDTGHEIEPGPGKTIIWDYSQTGNPDARFRIMLIADDNQQIDIQEIVDQVDSVRLRENLEFIEGIRHRTTGVPHLEAVKEDLKTRFESSNLEVSFQNFNFGGYEASNIIGRQIGTEKESEFYILDGHFDTVGNSPGADDNGSAVAGVMEAVRILSKYAFKNTVKYIGFDLEEASLNGSFWFAETGIEPFETMEGVLNFEMIGYFSEAPNSQTVPAGFDLIFPDEIAQLEADEFRGNFITCVGDNNSDFLIEAFEDASGQYVPELKILSLEAPFLIPDLMRSDHAPFWLNGLPAIMLTDGAEFRNSNYHTPNDTLGTIDFSFMTKVVKAAIATLAELAEVRHATTFWMDTNLTSGVGEAVICNIRIMPNPAESDFQILLDHCQFKEASLQLFDLQGNRVNFSKLNPGPNLRFEMDVRGWERGVYFIQIQYGEKYLTEKIVLN